MQSRHLFSELTPVTPPTCQPHNKQLCFESPQTPRSRICITTHATPSSHHLQQLFIQKNDDDMDVDIQPRGFVGEAIQNLIQNTGDVFGGHTNPPPPPPQVPMNIQAGLQNHVPACIVQRVCHTFHDDQI